MRIGRLLALFLITPAAMAATPTGRVAGKVSVSNAGVPASDAGGIVVYVVGFASTAPTTHAAMVQRGHMFSPELLPVIIGQVVDFPNEDWDTSHNVFSTDPRFNLGQYRAGRGAAPSQTFTEPGPVEVFCDIHPDMAATVLVLPNAAFATTSADGRFEIAAVPPGTWDVFADDRRAVVPAHGQVTVTAGAAAAVDLAIDRTRFDFSHKTWSGTDYGDRPYSTPVRTP